MSHPPPPRRALRAGPRLRGSLAAALALFAFTLGAFDVYSPDAPFHLAVGRFLVRHRAWPTAADLLWTQPPRPWVDTEWLFQLALYGVHRLGGVAALVALRGLLLAGAALALWAACSRRAPRLAAAVIGLCLAGAAPSFGMRPGLVTLVMLSLFWLVLERGSARAVRFGLPLLALAWANLHGYWVAGPALLGLVALGRAVDARRGRPARAAASPRRLAAAAGWCVAAALVTPNGVGGFVYPFRAASGVFGWRTPAKQRIIELRSPWRLGPRAPADLAVYPWLVAALALGFALNWRRARASDAFVAAAGFAASCAAARNVGPFAIVIAPILARNFAGQPLAGLRRLARRRPRAARALACAASALLFAAAAREIRVMASDARYARQGLAKRFGFGWSRAVFPIGPMRFAVERGVSGPLFNSFDAGGFVLWAAGPRLKPFINAHTDLYPPAFYLAYEQIRDGTPAGLAELDRRGVQAAALTLARGRYPLARALLRRGWKLVYLDDTGALLLRADGPNAALAERFGRPVSWPGWAADEKPPPDESPRYPDPLRRVLRVLRVLPARAARPARRYLRARFLLRVGGARAARKELERVAALAPDWADPLVDLGEAYERLALFHRALRALERAARLAPASPRARAALGLLYARLGQRARAQAEFQAALAHTAGAERLKLQAMLLLLKGDAAGARAALRRALELGLNDGDAESLLRWLDARRRPGGT